MASKEVRASKGYLNRDTFDGVERSPSEMVRLKKSFGLSDRDMDRLVEALNAPIPHDDIGQQIDRVTRDMIHAAYAIDSGHYRLVWGAYFSRVYVAMRLFDREANALVEAYTHWKEVRDQVRDSESVPDIVMDAAFDATDRVTQAREVRA